MLLSVLQAILKAWNLACGCTGVAVVLIPAGVTSVLMSNTEFVGTKCSARIIFQVLLQVVFKVLCM